MERIVPIARGGRGLIYQAGEGQTQLVVAG